MPPTTARLDLNNFDTYVTGRSKPVLVAFLAAWCVPCKRMLPVMAEVTAELCDRVDFAQIDVDLHGVVAARHSARAVPTFVLIKNGVEVQRIVGHHEKAAFLAKIEAGLKHTA